MRFVRHLFLSMFSLGAFSPPSMADIVCPDSSYCIVVFNRTYGSGSQYAGQPYDYVSIAPDGGGETFFNLNGVSEADGLPDIDIQVYLRNCQGAPLVGVPAQETVVFNSALCICPGGNISDASTDIDGRARFTGTLAAGGCVTNLQVYADGVFICTLTDGSTTVKVNSADQTQLGISPCFADLSDLAKFATVLGVAGQYSICFDFDETGPPFIDVADLAIFANNLAHSGPPPRSGTCQ